MVRVRSLVGVASEGEAASNAAFALSTEAFVLSLQLGVGPFGLGSEEVRAEYGFGCWVEL